MGLKKKTRNNAGIQDIIEFLEKIKKYHFEISRFLDKHTDFEYFPYESQLQNYINDLHDIIGD